MKGLPALGLVALYLVLTLGPGLAASMVGGGRAPNFYPLLARLAGIAALAMFLMQFVTSGRYEAISGRIGLDRSMSFHRVAAWGAVLMLAVHITFILMRGRGFLSVDRFVGRLVAAFCDPQLLTGTIALVLALVLMTMALLLRRGLLPYVWWRVLHGLLALGIGGFALHHAITNARFFADPYGSTAVYLVAAIAFGSLSVSYILRPFLSFRHGATVSSARALTPDVAELRLKLPPDARFSFDAGQFAWLTLQGRHTVADNPFSIASAPSDLPELRFLIRKAGDMTATVPTLKPGTRVGVDGPHGSFTLAAAGTGPLVLIGGGIGVAPILSILRELIASNDPRPVRLLVSARTPADHIARAEIEKLIAGHDIKALYVVESDPFPGFAQGRCEPRFIEETLDGLNRSLTTAFVCGPPRMMDAAIGHLIDFGLRQDQIVMERFDYDGATDPISTDQRRRFVALLVAVFAGTALLAFWVFTHSLFPR